MNSFRTLTVLTALAMHTIMMGLLSIGDRIGHFLLQVAYESADDYMRIGLLKQMIRQEHRAYQVAMYNGHNYIETLNALAPAGGNKSPQGDEESSDSETQPNDSEVTNHYACIECGATEDINEVNGTIVCDTHLAHGSMKLLKSFNDSTQHFYDGEE